MASTTEDPGTPGLRISVNGRVAEVVIDRPRPMRSPGARTAN